MSKKRRITILVRDDTPDLDAVLAVGDVMAAGKISNDGKCYCYLTVSRATGIVVEAHVTRAENSSFSVWRNDEQQKSD